MKFKDNNYKVDTNEKNWLSKMLLNIEANEEELIGECLK